jgi:hypothetical protein
MSSARTLILLCLVATSLALVHLVPEHADTLAELIPRNSLFYFEMQPRSIFSPQSNDKLLEHIEEDQQWIQEALLKLPEQQRHTLVQLFTDPETRMAVAGSFSAGRQPELKRVDFLVLAQTSHRRFPELVELGSGWIREAIPPAHYIVLQKTPHLGVFVGEPPRRLYVYEEYPIFLVSNSPPLVSSVLQIRYKDLPSLARQPDFQKMQQAAGSSGALLYVDLASVLKQSGWMESLPIVSVLQALNFKDWSGLGYHWDEVQGRVVRRTILIGN